MEVQRGECWVLCYPMKLKTGLIKARTEKGGDLKPQGQRKVKIIECVFSTSPRIHSGTLCVSMRLCSVSFKRV